MYKRHRIVSIILFAAIFIMTYLLKADYSQIAEAAIAIVSIALAVYIGAASVILGSHFAEKLKNQRDGEIGTKTSLGVLATYLRIAGIFGLVTIVISAVYALKVELPCEFLSCSTFGYSLLEIASQILSSFACGMFSLNILFIWLILLFLINSMTKSV